MKNPTPLSSFTYAIRYSGCSVIETLLSPSSGFRATQVFWVTKQWTSWLARSPHSPPPNPPSPSRILSPPQNFNSSYYGTTLILPFPTLAQHNISSFSPFRGINSQIYHLENTLSDCADFASVILASQHIYTDFYPSHRTELMPTSIIFFLNVPNSPLNTSRLYPT